MNPYSDVDYRVQETYALLCEATVSDVFGFLALMRYRAWWGR